MANGAFTLQGFESPEEVQARIGKAREGAFRPQGDINQMIYQTAAQGAAGMGGALAGALGYEDPQVKKARARQGFLAGVDLTNKSAVGEAARNAMDTDPQLGIYLADRFSKMASVEKKAPKTINVLEGTDTVALEWKNGEWSELSRGQKPQSKTEVNINNHQATEFNKALGKAEGKLFSEKRNSAKNAVINIEANMKAVKLLDQGMKTGFGANFMVGVGQALRKVGVNYDDNDEINSQAYGALLAKQTAEIIKAFGAGTGLSDADREFARKAAGGEITMDEEALRIIMKLNTIASIRSIENYNKDAAFVQKESSLSYPLTVENPYSEQQMEGITNYNSSIGLTGKPDRKKAGSLKNKWLNLKQGVN